MSILDLLFHERPNLMLLEVPPEPSLVKYLLSEIGLSMPQYDTIDLSGYERLASATDLKTAAKTPLFQKLREHPAEWVDGFVTDTKLVKSRSFWGSKPSAVWTAAKTATISIFSTAIRSNNNCPSSIPCSPPIGNKRARASASWPPAAIARLSSKPRSALQDTA